MRAGVLVVGKAPVPGQAKTRLARTIGQEAAADVAAAALLDTMDAVERSCAEWPRMMVWSGDVRRAARSDEIRSRMRSWTVLRQRGDGLGERLAAAHADAAAEWGNDCIIVQIGTDTPQITPRDLEMLAVPLQEPPPRDATLGLAADGGWWGIASARAGLATRLADVPMSTPRTGSDTIRVLRDAGAAVALAHLLTDLDTWSDAVVIAAAAPRTRAAAAVRRLSRSVTVEGS